MRRTSGWVIAGLGLGALIGWRMRTRRFSLEGKTAVVTGGSRGLGLVIAHELGRRGARVAICARNHDELDRAGEELAAAGIEVLAVPCDLTDPASIDAFVRDVAARFGPVDVLVNNAGTIQVGPMEEMTIDDYEQAMAVHFFAPLRLVLALAPAMRERRAGRIVNVSSIGGVVSVPHLLPYGASKFALTGLSEGLRAELAKSGVLVTTVCPGLMRTGSPPNARFKGQHRLEYAWFSISDALPMMSMDAERAARRIVDACERGEAMLLLGAPAKLAAKVHGVAPGFVQSVLGLVARLLPAPGGIGTRAASGRESASRYAPSWLTTASDRASRRFNQVPR